MLKFKFALIFLLLACNRHDNEPIPLGISWEEFRTKIKFEGGEIDDSSKLSEDQKLIFGKSLDMFGYTGKFFARFNERYKLTSLHWAKENSSKEEFEDISNAF